VRLAALEALGLDAQLVAPPTPTLLYELEEGPAQAVARLYNESIAEVARGSGGRLIAAGTIPMGHPKLALSELEYAVGHLQIRAIYLSTSVAGRDLGDESFEPVFRRMAELGVPLQLHPSQGGGSHGRLHEHMLYNLLGNPFETAIAAASLISKGVLDRIPELRVVLVHGGGVFPYLSGRMQHGYSASATARGSQRPPRDYFSHFYFDTLVHDPAGLRFLFETVGADRIVIGTDTPYNMGDDHPAKTLEASQTGLTMEQLGANALQALGANPLQDPARNLH